MAREDFNVKVGFDTKSLENERKKFENLAGIGGGSSSGQKQRGTGIVASGIRLGLKALGIVGLIASVKIISDTLGVILGLINFFVVQFVLYVVKFFKDPFGSLIKLGAFIVNGIIASIETMINFLKNLIPGGEKLPNVELPRFQMDLIDQALQNYKDATVKAAEDGIVTNAESYQATKDFLTDLKNSFVKTSEFLQSAKENADLTKEEFNKTFLAEQKTAQSLEDGFINVESSWLSTFTSISGVASTLDRKAQEIADAINSIRVPEERTSGRRTEDRGGGVGSFFKESFRAIAGDTVTDFLFNTGG